MHEDQEGAGRLYRRYVLAALLVVYTLNYLDRQFLAVLAEPVKVSLHLTDTELGALTGPLFALFYTVIGVPIGLLADRTNRVRIIVVACSIWSLFTGACGLASGFLTLALPRMGVGFGEAGGSPPAYSILSDYFPPRERGAALAVYSLGVPFGTMLGAMSGGLLAHLFGWRVAFEALGALGLLVAPVFWLTVREPPRGRLDPAAVERDDNLFAGVILFFRRPLLAMTALASGVSAFAGYGALIWTPALLMRDKHMTLPQVSLYYAAMAGLTGALGTLASGWLVDKLGRRRASAYGFVPAAAYFVSLPFLALGVLSPTWPIALAFLAGPALLNNMFLPPFLAVVQNATPPRQRVVAGALLLFVMNLIGLGGGPFFVGFMSDRFKPLVGAAKGLEYGLLCLAPFFLLAVVCDLIVGWLAAREAALEGAA